ncbi:dihydroneopterin aldolase [Limnohabitans sp. B9-3]|jgi:dihydroneopterin aldolase|uniref:dihydroneopterin aldolase n=1 Tax=Limnohabitans sp. B9-3 TaxID=1100707 RepID=UPI000C1F08C1|nr:dihydroneopterin aldolase [Limnohabitans sp. B9-3]PIT72351.1 diguanylate cyclase [Limnohabitans sp. B9-3]
MTDTLLRHYRRLFLRGITVQANIGIHDFELQAAQRLIIDVDLYVSLEGTRPKDDHIDEVVDYDFVRNVVHERIARGHIGLQETLCDDILTRLLDHSGVMAARVSTRKPDVYPDCEAVGVEAFRAKPGVL